MSRRKSPWGSDASSPAVVDQGHRWLVPWLRFCAATMGLALGAVLVPWSWIEASTLGLGLEPIPDLPLSRYLVRTLSLLYAIYGSLMWVTAAAPSRHAPVIRYMAYAAIVFGIFVFFIDRGAGMPVWWIAVEVGGTAGSGCITLMLARGGPHGLRGQTGSTP